MWRIAEGRCGEAFGLLERRERESMSSDVRLAEDIGRDWRVDSDMSNVLGWR